VIDEAAVARAEAAGLIAIMDRCPAIEYRKRHSSTSPHK
jgi:predicted CoA-binding protein